jgi:hypothetical protein
VDSTVRQRCRTIIQSLALPPQFTIEDVVRRAASARGRAIELRPIDLSGVGLSGMLLWTRDRDIICYPTDTTGLHQGHIVAHELGHLLFDHSVPADPADPRHEPTAALPEPLRALVPGLSPQAIQGALGRSTHVTDHAPYSHRAELEAELFATLLHTSVRVDRSFPGWMFAGTA